MPANDLYKAVMSHTYQGVTCQTVLHFRSLVGGLFAQTLAVELSGKWRTWITNATVAQCSFDSVFVQLVSNQQADSFAAPVVPLATGVLGGQGMPPQSAAVISLRTGYYGRSRRGRYYHFGWPVSWLTNGKLNSQALATIDNFWFNFHNHYKVGGASGLFEYGVYSKKLGGYTIPYDLAGFTGYNAYQRSIIVGAERGRKA